MKKITQRALFPPLNFLLILVIVFATFNSCRKGEDQKFLNGYTQTNLVADTLGFNAAIIDPNLVNAWGVAIVPSGPIWISSADKGLSVIYDNTGATLRPPVTIEGGQGAPTGQVFNSTTGFRLSNGNPARFIFAVEGGTIAAWNGGNDAAQVADGTKWNAVYKGIAMGSDGGANFLYVTNFHGRKIDVLDSMFNYVSDKPFKDEHIPDGFGPFNIRNIGGYLYVTYAKLLAPDNKDDEAGPGNGFVDVFTTGGKLVKRFASRGVLNSPWGIAQSSMGIPNVPNAILIGNFGDGRINVFSPDGHFIGPLRDNTNHPIEIEGLWSIENNVPNTDPNRLYFTAGPNDEEHGLFGYLSK